MLELSLSLLHPNSIIIGNRKFYNRPIEKKISFISKKKFDISDPLTGMKMFNIKKLKKEILKLNFKKNDFGLYFLRWIKDFTHSNVTINVKKQNLVVYNLQNLPDTYHTN